MTKWTRYNNTCNEGGEGYNPYRKGTRNPEIPESLVLADQIDRVLRIMSGISTDDSRYAAKTTELGNLRAAYEAAKIKEAK